MTDLVAWSLHRMRLPAREIANAAVLAVEKTLWQALIAGSATCLTTLFAITQKASPSERMCAREGEGAINETSAYETCPQQKAP